MITIRRKRKKEIRHPGLIDHSIEFTFDNKSDNSGIYDRMGIQVLYTPSV